ncbi:hypothetical protein HDU96_010393 [Phlyctochytrium bullatum]|nr:hypothetical protein HDU96_010393 [Phlyctochytrium bullatum]
MQHHPGHPPDPHTMRTPTDPTLAALAASTACSQNPLPSDPSTSTTTTPTTTSHLLRIVCMVLGTSPDTAFILLIDSHRPVSLLRHRLCLLLGNITDYTLSLFSVDSSLSPGSSSTDTPAQPLQKDTRLLHAATAAICCGASAPTLHPDTETALRRWLDPNYVPDLFSATCLLDPFASVGSVLGFAAIGDAWRGRREEDLTPADRERLERVHGDMDAMHLLVSIEQDPGLPPSYDDLDEKSADGSDTKPPASDPLALSLATLDLKKDNPFLPHPPSPLPIPKHLPATPATADTPDLVTALAYHLLIDQQLQHDELERRRQTTKPLPSVPAILLNPAPAPAPVPAPVPAPDPDPAPLTRQPTLTVDNAAIAASAAKLVAPPRGASARAMGTLMPHAVAVLQAAGVNTGDPGIPRPIAPSRAASRLIRHPLSTTSLAAPNPNPIPPSCSPIPRPISMPPAPPGQTLAPPPRRVAPRRSVDVSLGGSAAVQAIRRGEEVESVLGEVGSGSGAG